MSVPTASDLNERIAIQTQTDAPNDAMGCDIVYGDPVYVWAKVKPVSGALYFGSQQLESGVTHRFYIRTGPDVTARHVIVWNGKRFRPKRVECLGNAKHITSIEAQELEEV